MKRLRKKKCSCGNIIIPTVIEFLVDRGKFQEKCKQEIVGNLCEKCREARREILKWKREERIKKVA